MNSENASYYTAYSCRDQQGVAGHYRWRKTKWRNAPSRFLIVQKNLERLCFHRSEKRHVRHGRSNGRNRWFCNSWHCMNSFASFIVFLIGLSLDNTIMWIANWGKKHKRTKHSSFFRCMGWSRFSLAVANERMSISERVISPRDPCF